MENQVSYCNATSTNGECQGILNERKKHEIQITILMNLLKIPIEERNFRALKNKIEKMIEENDNLTTKNDNCQLMNGVISPMENILNNPGLQHISEMILFNLDLEDLKKCQNLNKSFKNMMEDPSIFFLRKWRTQRGLSKENHDDWVNTIQLIKNTNVESNVKLYLEKVIKNGHVMDIPCFIDSNAVEKSTEFTFDRALEERELGILQIFASMENNPNKAEDERLGFRMTVIQIAATDGDLNIIKIIAPIVKNPNEIGDNSDFGTPIHYAAGHGHLDIIKFFISFIDIDNPFIPDQWWFGLPGYTPIMYAAFNGHIDVLKLLAPISKNPNEETNEDYDGNVKTPIQLAQERGHHEFAKLLKSFIKTGKF